MKRRKRTEIVVEREQILVITRLSTLRPPDCRQCGDGARMVSVDEAASIVRLSARAIYRLVESQRVHFTEPPDGKLLVCLGSLSHHGKGKAGDEPVEDPRPRP